MPVTVAGAIERFEFSESGLRHLMLNDVGKDIARRAVRVESAAKRNASEPPRAGPNSGSVPGHGPAVRTGRLRTSIAWRMGIDAESIYADIGSAVLYAPYVELGTTKMEARPFLRPALEAARI